MSDKLIEVLIEHGTLVVALGVMYWQVTPRMLKATLRNGGGEIVRRIVQEENTKQSERTHAAIDKALGDHEHREFRQYGDLGEKVGMVRERLAALDARVSDHVLATASSRGTPA